MDTCDICRETCPIKPCQDCKKVLCKSCMPLHKKEKVCPTTESYTSHTDSDHTVLSYIPQCSTHKNTISKYCFDCYKGICGKCSIQSNHTTIGVGETAKNIRGGLHTMETDLCSKNTELARYKELCSEKEVKLKSVEKEIENEELEWTRQILSTKTSLICKVEDNIKKYQISYHEKNILLTKAKSILDAIPAANTSLKTISLWEQFRRAIDEFDKISENRMLSQTLVFYPGVRNQMNWCKEFGSLETNQIKNEESSNEQTNDIDNISSRLQAVTLNKESQDSRDEVTNAPRMVITNKIKDCTADLIAILYNFAVETDRTEFHENEKQMLMKKSDREMKQVSQQAGYVIEHVLKLRKTCIEKEEEVRKLIIQCADWTNEQNDSDMNTKAEYESLIKAAKEDTIATYSNEITALEKRTKNLQTENKSLTTEIETLKLNSYEALKKAGQRYNVQLEAGKIEITKLQKKIVEEKDKIAKLEKQVSNLSDEISSKTKQVENLIKEKENIQTRFRAYVYPFEQKLLVKEENEKLLKCLLNDKDDVIAALKEQVGKIAVFQKENDERIAALNKEKEDLQTRLSSIAGDKLTKGNPAITDLGDPNRPMKIGEMYGELYDNEWTDAMDCMDKVKEYYPDMETKEVEEIVIRHLFRLLMDGDVSSFPGRKEIIMARRQNTDETVNFFLEHQNNCDINAPNKDGWTPLWQAYGNNDEDSMKLLLKSGADKNVRNAD
ncbi:Hypothetical predicted protein [Mytilus galloprovincialis]|uniref:B box-type domain-containing protein n=1 Tax=Mytilus galloprovincialis TaxID=29158 RepID=A0A8B6CIS5_MYTGA|nr:Hypothetical predicted protein [Mytilus galloprovincialis]